MLPKLDVSVPRAPFLLMWSPNSQSLTYLSNSEGPDGPTIRLAEVLVAAAKNPFKTKCKTQTYTFIYEGIGGQKPLEGRGVLSPVPSLEIP